MKKKKEDGDEKSAKFISIKILFTNYSLECLLCQIPKCYTHYCTLKANINCMYLANFFCFSLFPFLFSFFLWRFSGWPFMIMIWRSDIFSFYSSYISLFVSFDVVRLYIAVVAAAALLCDVMCIRYKYYTSYVDCEWSLDTRPSFPIPSFSLYLFRFATIRLLCFFPALSTCERTFLCVWMEWRFLSLIKTFLGAIVFIFMPAFFFSSVSLLALRMCLCAPNLLFQSCMNSL